jgi:hypothetical protein
MIKITPENVINQIKDILSAREKLSKEELAIKTLIYNYEQKGNDYIDVQTIFEGSVQVLNQKNI